LQNSWHYISSASNDIEFTMSEIASCECLITEAMHGAIVADALRVPWKRFRFFAHIHEGEAVSEVKWNDWLASINIKKNVFWELPYINSDVFPKRYFKNYFAKKQRNIINKKIAENFNIIEGFSLSTDAVFDNIILKMKNVINEFKQKKFK